MSLLQEPDDEYLGQGNGGAVEIRSRWIQNYFEERICRLGNGLMDEEVSRMTPRPLVHCKTGRTMVREANRTTRIGERKIKGHTLKMLDFRCLWSTKKESLEVGYPGLKIREET